MKILSRKMASVRIPRWRSRRNGFSLIEVLVAVAVLLVALLPALGALRHLLQTSEHLLRKTRAHILLDHKLAEAHAGLRRGIVPAEVASGTEDQDDPLRWVLRREESAERTGEVRLFSVRCSVASREGPLEAEGLAQFILMQDGTVREPGSRGP